MQRAITRWQGLAALCVPLSLAACSGSSAATSPDASAPPDGGLPIMTHRGPVTGILDGDTLAFLGIPYAAPPIGELRWRPPTEPAAWTAPRAASSFGLACPQRPNALTGQPVASDEDCLTLNVWTPARSGTAPWPVLVYIHGGGYTTGASNDPVLGGANLAARGPAVVVTLNYRLGQLGFLAHPALTAEDPNGSSGNFGLLDMLAGLAWVRTDIAGFGGDPDNVTVVGESAGSLAVCTLAASPLAAGLFHRIIGQSGACRFVVTPLHDGAAGALESAESLGRGFASELGCSDAPDVVACLRGKPASDVIASQIPSGFQVGPASYQPNIDGHVLPEPPWAAYRDGTANAVGYLGGVVRDEATAFTLLTGTAPATEAAYRAAVQLLVPAHVDALVGTLYPSSGYASVAAAYNALLTDIAFLCPTRAQAQQFAARGLPSYLYEFARLTALGRATGLGVYHSSDVAYVFGNFAAGSASELDSAISSEMMDYWTRFAATGDPNRPGNPAWPGFMIPGDGYVEIGDTTSPKVGLHASHCDTLDSWLDGG